VSDIIASGTRVDGQSLFCEHSYKPGNKKASKSCEASAVLFAVTTILLRV